MTSVNSLAVYIKSVEHGLGLFANRIILRGEIVTEYDGRIIDRNEALMLRRTQAASHVCSIDYHMLIDGLKSAEAGRGHGSLVNHSKENFNSQIFRSDSKFFSRDKHDTRTGCKSLMRVWIRAIKTIGKDEEILVNYGARSWKIDHSI